MSRTGWVAAGLTVVMLTTLWVLTIHPFLAKTRRVETNVLVVEGWVHKYAMRAAAAEFKQGDYQEIFTTGGPLVGTDGATNDFNTAASVGADELKKAGVAGDHIQMVPSHVASRDRTFNSALALREWLQRHQPGVGSLNIMTEDVHARRTQLLFQEALGPDITVGIIAIPDPDYDPGHWWRYSEGFREVIAESIAYLYARLIFHPTETSS